MPACPQKNKSSLLSALSKPHLKILTFIIQIITSAPLKVVQMNLLKDKICVFLPYALGTYHSAWHVGGTEWLSNGMKLMYPSTLSCGIKGRNTLFSFSVFNANGRCLATHWF